MKVGKVPESVLKRSVIRQIRGGRPEVVLGAGVGEDCAALKIAADETLVLSTDPITGTTRDIGSLAIQVTVNDLASAGAEPIGVLLTVLLPESAEEPVLREIMAQAQEACERASVQLVGGHTEVTPVVREPLLSVCGVGKVKDGRLVTTAGARPGMDLVVTKWVGLEGTSILAKEHRERLCERFPASYVEDAMALDRYISVLGEARIAARIGVGAMHDVTEGGIFGALWEMAEASGVGLEVDLKKIPIRQETVEICEFFGISPYQLISSGSMLIAADDGAAVARAISGAGINAAIIGRVTEGRDRVAWNGDERRYLGPPKEDELYSVPRE